MIRHPFFGSLVYQHELELTDAVPTAAATPDGRMLFNPEFVEQYDTQNLMFLIAHEVMHIVFAHSARRGNRDRDTYNIACDAVINEILVAEGVGQFIDGGIRMEGAQDETSENIYNKIYNPTKAKQPSGDGDDESSGSNGNGSGQGRRGRNSPGEGKPYTGKLTVKDLEKDGDKPITEAEAKQKIAEGKLKIGQAAALARMQGKLGSGLSRIVDKILESRLPWHQILERYLTGKAEQRYNWSRPHKRRLNVAYMPSRDKYPSMGEVVLGIDVSGSISDKEVGEFIGHCRAIFDLCHPKKVYVVYCTTRVEAVDEFERGEEIVPRKNMWYGGTHMPAIMDWIDNNDIDADACITFTDGYTDYPSENQVPCPLVWVLSTDYKPRDPQGEVIYAVEEG